MFSSNYSTSYFLSYAFDPSFKQVCTVGGQKYEFISLRVPVWHKHRALEFLIRAAVSLTISTRLSSLQLDFCRWASSSFLGVLVTEQFNNQWPRDDTLRPFLQLVVVLDLAEVASPDVAWAVSLHCRSAVHIRIGASAHLALAAAL